MATLTATRAAATLPIFKPTGAGIVCAAYGSYDLAANPVIADIVQLCRIPAGATVVGGWFRAEDIDTNGAPTLEINLGWAANGAEAADPDGFGDFGVMNGTAVPNYLPEGGSIFPLNGLLRDGFLTFTRETVIQATVVAAALTFAAGTISAVVFYVVP